jgi:hypothetical protein
LSNLLVDFDAGPYPIFRERLLIIISFLKKQMSKISPHFDNKLNKLLNAVLELFSYILRSHEIMKAFFANFFENNQDFLFEITPYIDGNTSHLLENIFL